MAVWDERPVFVDTNILFYALDKDAGEKRVRAREVIAAIWEAKTGVISTQVLSEWAVNLRKKAGLPWSQVRQLVEPYLTWRVISVEPQDPPGAMRLAARNQLSYWDALIVLSAKKGGVAELLTEDLNAGQTIAGVRVLNPLQEPGPAE